MISRSPELRLLYDNRAKAELDQFSALKDARAEGVLIGRIELLQQLLGDPETDRDALESLGFSKLDELAGDLQQRLDNRTKDHD